MGARALPAVRILLVAAAALAPVGWKASAVSTEPGPDPVAPTRLLFIGEPGATILVHGTYPVVPSPCREPVTPFLHARYPGTLQVGRDTDGTLFVIDVLPLEDYLKGIAEMPVTWPLPALQAQAVAARSYALAHLGGGTDGARLGYDLCATTACQVYRGLGPADGPYGERWAKAVKSTAGRILEYQGRPADTVYFSTSNGGTLANETVFGSAPLPYLRPVVEGDDGASPLSHWRAVLSFADVGAFLSKAGVRSAPVTGVRRSGDSIVVSGGGASTTLPVSDFRSDMNAWGHCLDPATYPSYDGGSRLPQTVPSIWFDMSTEGQSVVLTGRGWGHGVGMVQWGAFGKAERGMKYRQILAAYYGGLKPVKGQEPATVRILVASGLRTVLLEPAGTVSVEGLPAGPPPWKVRKSHGGMAIGSTDPLPSYIDPSSLLKAPKALRSGHRAKVTVELPELAVLHLAVQADGSPEVPVSEPVTAQPGRRTVWMDLSGSLPGGTYRLRAVTTDGTDIAPSAPLTLRVIGPTPTPTPSSTPSPTSTGPQALPSSPASSGSGWAIPTAAGAAAVVLTALAFLWRARGRHRKAAPSEPRVGGP